MSLAASAGIIMLVGIVIMLVLGIPIAISIGLSSAFAMLMVLPYHQAMVTSAQRLFTGANQFSLLAIPFFILAGNIMNNGGIAKRLVDLAKVISHRFPGCLAQTNAVGNYAVRGNFWVRSSRCGSYGEHDRSDGGKRRVF